MAGNLKDGWWVVSIASLAFITWYAVRGWRMGALRTLLWVAGFAFGLLLAARYAGAAAGLLGKTIPGSAREAIAFVVIVLAVMVVVDILNAVLQRFLHSTPLTTLNRSAGAMLGIVKGVLIVALVGVLLAILPLPSTVVQTYARSGVVQGSTEFGGVLINLVKDRLPEPAKAFLSEARSTYVERMRVVLPPPGNTAVPRVP